MPTAESVSFTVFGEPKSKARPRMSRGGHVYTDKKTVTAEEAVAAAFSVAAGPGFVVDTSGRSTYRVAAIFHAFTRQRRDVDNMLKLVLDGLNGKAFADDSYVEAVYGEKRYVATRPEARTEVTVTILDDGILGSRVADHCAECQKEMWVSPSQRGAIKFCSKECREQGHFGKVEVPCSHCGTLVERWPSLLARAKNVYCDRSCRSAHLRGVKA